MYWVGQWTVVNGRMATVIGQVEEVVVARYKDGSWVSFEEDARLKNAYRHLDQKQPQSSPGAEPDAFRVFTGK